MQASFMIKMYFNCISVPIIKQRGKGEANVSEQRIERKSEQRIKGRVRKKKQGISDQSAQAPPASKAGYDLLRDGFSSWFFIRESRDV